MRHTSTLNIALMAGFISLSCVFSGKAEAESTIIAPTLNLSVSEVTASNATPLIDSVGQNQILSSATVIVVTNAPNPERYLIPCGISADDAAVTGVPCGGAVPTLAGVGVNLDEVLQSVSRVPTDFGNNNPDDLLLGGGSLIIDGSLSPDQLGALAPAAGGASSQADDSVDCVNAYLQNSWSAPAMQQRCGAEDNNQS